MTNNDNYACWVEVDLDAIQGNVRRAAAISGSGIMAVVKANGYGHGAVRAAKAALQAGAAWCAVARLEEALDLRAAGVEAPILLLGYLPPGRLEQAVAARLSLAAWTDEHIQAAGEAARSTGVPARLHLKVDTGMGRIGAGIDDTPYLARRLAETPGVVFEGLFTHFARADEADPAFSDLQEGRFHAVVDELTRRGLRPKVIHAANSPAGLTRPGAAFDLIRLGIALYGLQPSSERPLPEGFRPALAWKAVLSHVKTLPPGSGVSYNHEYVTRGQERIGTIPVGYADGFRRARPNQVLIGGQAAPVVGRVCMDQVMVNLDGIAGARAGDEVVIIGRQGGAHITAEDVARRWGTNNYDTVCAIGPRVPRLYSGSAAAE